jgi:hypothetical protein
MVLHQSTIVYTAIGTALIWAATISMALFEVGSSRLHLTFLAGAVVSAFGLIAAIVVHHLREYVLHGVDELHGLAEDVKTKVFSFERVYTLVARAVMEGLIHGKKADDLAGIEREVATWSSSGEWPVVGGDQSPR